MDNHDVLREDRHRYHTFARAYDSAASAVADRGRLFSVITASLSALVSSAVFVGLAADNVDPAAKVATAVVSLAATVLGAAAAVLDYQARSEAYRQAALSAVGLQQRADELIVRPQLTNAEVAEFHRKATETEEAWKRRPPARYYKQAERDCDTRRAANPFESIASLSGAPVS